MPKITKKPKLTEEQIQEELDAAFDKANKKDQISSPRGTQDILPHDHKYWEYITESARLILRGWYFQEIQTPIFEEKKLYERGVGQETDIVQKEMFELKSRSRGTHYVLRPEATAGIARAYLEHGMRSWPRPVKLFTVGPFFRYERPQAGRFRQHHQLSLEVLGSAAPVTDVEVMYVLHLLFKRLGLEDYVVQVNSLGLPAERKEYIKLLKDHYRRNIRKLSREDKERLKRNPLRVLDSKDEKAIRVANTAPRLIDHLSETSKKHFEYVTNMLGELEVPFEVNPRLVRGLDYYTHTVFEFVSRTAGEQGVSFTSGGRYDGLVRQLGGRDTAAVGAGIGIERVVDRIKKEGIDLTLTDQPLLYVAQLGDRAKVVALKLMRKLNEAGIPFAEGVDRDGMQPQLKAADRLGVGWAAIIGQKEVLDGTIILRNMESGMQEVVDQANLVEELQKRLHLE
ncbi:MAG: histidine--tRNA ligase [Candidatus Andersenbacteria bacterium]|nr:histidine--tRNA ligase [Candidatus Andersenbacteria bacterium]MBI3251017.1 histidine--tRNA ligase [Candidatus Andersenbacteria bacterium]